MQDALLLNYIRKTGKICSHIKGLHGSRSWSYGTSIYNYLCNWCLSPLMLLARIPLMARWTTLCDEVCQWFATDRWFSPDPPVTFTSKCDRHDIILFSCSQRIVDCFTFRSFVFECATWWLFQMRVVHAGLDFCDFLNACSMKFR